MAAMPSATLNSGLLTKDEAEKAKNPKVADHSMSLTSHRSTLTRPSCFCPESGERNVTHTVHSPCLRLLILYHNQSFYKEKEGFLPPFHKTKELNLFTYTLEIVCTYPDVFGTGVPKSDGIIDEKSVNLILLGGVNFELSTVQPLHE